MTSELQFFLLSFQKWRHQWIVGVFLVYIRPMHYLSYIYTRMMGRVFAPAQFRWDGCRTRRALVSALDARRRGTRRALAGTAHPVERWETRLLRGGRVWSPRIYKKTKTKRGCAVKKNWLHLLTIEIYSSTTTVSIDLLFFFFFLTIRGIKKQKQKSGCAINWLNSHYTMILIPA